MRLTDRDMFRALEERGALSDRVVQALILENSVFTSGARRMAIGERGHEALNLRYAAQLRSQLAERKAKRAGKQVAA